MMELLPVEHIRRHRHVAVLGAAILTAITIANLPGLDRPMQRVPLLLPIFSSVLTTLNSVIAYLILLQFHMDRKNQTALISVAFGYSAALSMVLLFSLPGVLTDSGKIAHLSPALGWLWASKFCGHALLVMVAMLWQSRQKAPRPDAPPGSSLQTCVAATAPMLLAGTVYALLDGLETYLPQLVSEHDSYAGLAQSQAGALTLLSWIAALSSVLYTTRLRRSFDCWLAFSTYAYLLYLGTSFSSATRFTQGWYVARFFELCAAAALLGALLFEILRMQKQLKQLYKTAYTTSIRDSLTGLYSRRYFDTALQRELAANERSQRPLSLLIVDIDFFKQYNDTYGHQAGDMCIRRIAGCLLDSVRSGDIVARYGGEEFVIILPDTDADMALEAAERLRDAVMALGIPAAASAAPHARITTISIGLGCKQAQAREVTPDMLIRQADTALYDAKRQGRNRVACCTT